MTLWKDPKWCDAEKRIEQLDDHIHRTGQARFGLKTYGKNEKLEAVIRHFNRVAQKYDFMNSLLSFGIHHVWKRKAVRLLALKYDDWVLDVCGGTGDLARLAASRIGPEGKVVIYDISRAMMDPLFFEFSKCPCGVSSHNSTRRHIPCDHAAGPDDRVFADGNAT